MADENKGVIAGTAGMDAAILFSKTREAFQGAAAPPNRRNNTGVECPVCKEAGILLNPVWSDQGGLACNSGHKFADTDDLMSRPHGTVPVAMPQAVQENYVQVSFSVPASVAQSLQNKYGGDANKMKATFAALAAHMAEPNMVLIGEADLRRLGDACGMPIRTSAELYGVIKGQQTQINDLQEAQKLSPAQGQQAAGGTMLRRGELILWFNPEVTKRLAERAANSSVRMEEFLEQYIGSADENNWF